MKSLFCYSCFLVFVIFLSSCRKDDSGLLPEPQGNLLVLQLNNDYSLEGGSELIIPDLTVSGDTLNTAFDLKNCPPQPPETIIISKAENDTLLYFYNRMLNYPSIQMGGVFALNDSCLANSTHQLLTYSLGNDGDYDNNQLVSALDDLSILHAYLQKENSSKIAVMKYVVYEYDPEFNVTIPVVKFFVLVGYAL